MSMRARVSGKGQDAKTKRTYLERGIKICERWEFFSNFLIDMGERPPGMTIDRIDVNGNYEPGNCRWATWEQQNKNQRSTRYITYDGVTLCVKDWAKRIGMAYQTLHERLQRGWEVEQALTIKSSPANSSLRISKRWMKRKTRTDRLPNQSIQPQEGQP
jgi:hypothetical protein